MICQVLLGILSISHLVCSFLAGIFHSDIPSTSDLGLIFTCRHLPEVVLLEFGPFDGLLSIIKPEQQYWPVAGDEEFLLVGFQSILKNF